MKLTKLLISIIIIALIILSAAMMMRPAHTYNRSSQHLAQTPDWFMRGVTGVKTNKRGQLNASIASPSLQHLPGKNSIALKNPYFVVYDKHNIPWHISAKHGEFFQDKPVRIVLSHHVVIKEMPSKNSKHTRVYTSKLTLYTATNLAKTKQPVTVIQQSSTVHAVGMIAHLKTGNIQFLSQTRAEYNDPAP
jgi:LPS export ABC transporter protein LptC